MGCMLRSDKMTKYIMYLQPETAYCIVHQLGDLGCVQFIDMYPDVQLFQRNNVMEVCRFSEMERKLNYIHNEMKLNDIEPNEQSRTSEARPLIEFTEFEVTLEQWKNGIQEITKNEVSLLQSYLELVQFHYVLHHMGPVLGRCKTTKEFLLPKQTRAGIEAGRDIGRLLMITGIVRRARCHAFHRMLWRVSRGIIFFRQASEDKILIDPKSRLEIRKIAFLLICQGEALAERIQKVCTGFEVKTFAIPSTDEERAALEQQLYFKINELNLVLEKSKYVRCQYLRKIARTFRDCIGDVKKSKAVYHVLNMFRIVDKYLICYCWIPDDDLYLVNDILSACSAKSLIPSFVSKIPTEEAPPTYHRVNKFTRGFQNLINAYGDSTYRELNPGLYTLVTFPFLFAMMFGDLGHGFILVLCGVWMWKNEKKFLAKRSTNEIWNIFFGGRYVVLMMGLFSVFTGFCYNDMFSRAFSLSPSYWLNLHTVASLAEDDSVDLNPSDETRHTYLFGEDPVWRLAKNKIMFENSFKMKISIVIGIIHMMFGIILSFFNYRYFKRTYSIYFQFIPEILFLSLMFFWLVILCFLKWFMYSPKNSDPEYNTACAPQILILFIDMVLMSETKPANDGCTRAYIFDGQRTVQMVLVFTAVACVPIMLLGTPIYLIITNNRKRKKAELALKTFLRKSPKPKNSRDVMHEVTTQKLNADIEKYTVEGGEVLLHQGVHTIEFVLSTISHTASYLRLWALSLAHSQLSEMLWAMILSKLALQVHTIEGAFRLIPIFALWAVFTVSILVVMEGLSAFLHCLRLHWVEFMSKFYSGGGWPFRPYSFEAMLQEDRAEPDARCRKFTPRVLKPQ